MKKDNSEFNKYLYQGLTLFGAIGASIILYFIILSLGNIIGFISKILIILSPIFIGLLFAYLLNPIVNYFETKFSRSLSKKIFKDKKNHPRFERALSITVTYLLVATVIFLFIEFVVPNLLDSLQVVISNVPVYINNIYNYLKDMVKGNSELSIPIEQLNQNATEYVKNIIVPSMDTIMANITLGITGFVKGLINVAIGLIVSVYLIYDKEAFLNSTNDILKLILPKRAYETAITTLNYTDKIFGGFMIAKIIDSLIIGVITFLVLTIFNIPYAILISVIVGVTNIIPYFGPIIGAVPCAILLLLVSPAKCLTFVIAIFMIQQFDGNILGPRLIGGKTGIKSFWVLFSILLFGGLFGFIGMIFGVPVFAVIYSVITTNINKKLELKNSQ